MKKGTLHIHLMNFPSKTRNKGNNQSNQFHLCNRGKSFSVFNAFLLRKSLRNEACFMLLKNNFKGKFGPIEPSTLYNVLSERSGNQVPGLIHSIYHGT
jgi:hypothetical protein